jgi:hypothetical protein
MNSKEKNNITFNAFSDSKFSAVVGGQEKVIPDKQINLIELIAILSNPAISKLSAAVRACKDPLKRSKLKAKLPYFTPYGTFSYRKNISILTYNKNILAVDIDEIPAAEVAIVFNIIKNNKACILAYISAKGKGVKALINVNYNNEPDPIEDHYNLLSTNYEYINKELGISNWKLDKAQFKLSQPFFMFNADGLYYNLNTEPLELKLSKSLFKERKAVIAKEKQLQAEYKPSYVPEELKPAVTKELQNIYTNDFLRKLNHDSKAARHPQIYKVKAVAEVMHYADAEEQHQFAVKCYAAIVLLYGSEAEADAANAYKSFMAVWNNAACKKNEAIESILSKGAEK